MTGSGSIPRRAVILGAARGARRLDSAKSYPTALESDRGGRRAVDWQLAAFHACGIHEVAFVGGYHIEKVMGLYSGLRFFYHPEWEQTGEAAALAAAADMFGGFDGVMVVATADVVFRAGALEALMTSSADITLGVTFSSGAPDAEGETLEAGLGISEADSRRAAFGRVVCLRGRVNALVSDVAKAEVRRNADARLLDTLSALRAEGATVAWHDLRTDWARVDQPQSLARFAFSTKAQTLDRLRPLVRHGSVPRQVRFTVAEWAADRLGILGRIQADLGREGHFVVRSSALAEDTWESSAAGRFRSVLNVQAGSDALVTQAVESVIAGFVAAGITDGHQEVFVQRQVADVVAAGVLFTRELSHRGPYLVMNVDTASGRTDTVTSGGADGLQTVVAYREAQTYLADAPLLGVLRSAREIEQLVGHDELDIEFAVDKAGTCHVLQVRPMAPIRPEQRIAEEDVRDEVAAIKEFFSTLVQRRPHLAGATTVLGTMPDWNPAEMIGTCPRPLALSLYQHLITDRVWAEARRQVGYRNALPEPLLVALAGRPFIDVRASLNSFLPAETPEFAAESIVDAALARLAAQPHLHDKLEFEVTTTCLAFDFDRRADALPGLDARVRDAWRRTLLSLTDNVIRGVVKPIAGQLSLLEGMGRRRQRLLAADAGSQGLPRRANHLIEDCARFGTLPFSVLARYAFIATALLRSSVEEGALSPGQLERLLRAIPSVAGQFSRSLADLRLGRITRADFLAAYGHLRPGSYDLLSPTYGDAPDLYLAHPHVGGVEAEPIEDPRAVLAPSLPAIGRLLARAGFRASTDEFVAFVLAAIPAREFAKFEFTKNLSAALSLFSQLGHELDMTPDDISYVPLWRLLRLGTDSPSAAVSAELRRLAGFNRKRHQLTLAIQLPDLIATATDIECFTLSPGQPNFVTSKKVTASCLDVSDGPPTVGLAGRIVMITSADPGYDWIFGHDIAGLITKYGGAASHMTIRAAEFGLPAAIGCGEVLYRQVQTARAVELDCAGRRIRVID